MKKESGASQLPPLVDELVDLADEIDGIADFGIIVCLTGESVSGRHGYITKCCGKVRSLVDAILSSLKQGEPTDSARAAALQSELMAGADLLLNAFANLEHFRSLDKEVVHSLTESLLAGWEAIHKSIREIADTLGLLDRSWYATIQGRQDRYRNNLQQSDGWFQELLDTAPKAR
jgi:hypothetical protein